MKRKHIYLISKNFYKLKEYQEFFHNYNVEVKVIDDFTYYKNSEKLLLRYVHLLKSPRTLTVLCDETQLFRESDNRRMKNLNETDDLELVYTKTILFYLKKDGVTSLISTPHHGVIDYSSKGSSKKVFGWDDVFILRSTGLSYLELKNRKMKNHCRQEVLSDFATNHLYYTKNINLNFNKFDQEGVIEFSRKIFDFVNKNKYLNSPTVKSAKLQHLFQYALNNGGFFRSSKNRRQKNYWNPGLNAGIPLVPKKDEVHEITFFVHDLCHFVLPDLIFNGKSCPLYDRVYIIYRMMSEALTLVIADMIFIDCLVQDGVEYDFAKRKIYPLYQAIKAKNPDISLEKLMAANVQYCLLGDDTGYMNLLQEPKDQALIAFKKKYEPFFAADFKWTKRNLENMKSNADSFNKWQRENADIFKDQNLPSIEDYTKHTLKLSPDQTIKAPELVDLISKQTISHFITILNTEVSYSVENQISNSFKKYMLGQMMILYRIDFLHYSKFLKTAIGDRLRQSQLKLTDIKRIRALYNDYLTSLESEYHLINKDDMETYKEVYPIFDSFFVFYDKKEEIYASLKEASAGALG